MSVNVNPIMAAIVEAAETLNTAPDDYINPDDGLKYCGKCHTPKEAYFPDQYRKNGLDMQPERYMQKALRDVRYDNVMYQRRAVSFLAERLISCFLTCEMKVFCVNEI